MLIRSVALALAVSLLPCVARAAESYVCTIDEVTGFGFDAKQKKWVPKLFETTESYVVRRSKVADTAWEMIIVGERNAMSFCKTDDANFLECHGLYDFYLSRKNLRFVISGSSVLGYLHKEDRESASTPFLALGKCSALKE